MSTSLQKKSDFDFLSLATKRRFWSIFVWIRSYSRWEWRHRRPHWRLWSPQFAWRYSKQNWTIVYDTYDLCAYHKEGKLQAFNVAMLKTILRHFEVPFRAKDRKTDLIRLLKAHVHPNGFARWCFCFETILLSNAVFWLASAFEERCVTILKTTARETSFSHAWPKLKETVSKMPVRLEFFSKGRKIYRRLR